MINELVLFALQDTSMLNKYFTLECKCPVNCVPSSRSIEHSWRVGNVIVTANCKYRRWTFDWGSFCQRSCIKYGSGNMSVPSPYSSFFSYRSLVLTSKELAYNEYWQFIIAPLQPAFVGLAGGQLGVFCQTVQCACAKLSSRGGIHVTSFRETCVDYLLKGPDLAFTQLTTILTMPVLFACPGERCSLAMDAGVFWAFGSPGSGPSNETA